MIEKQRRRWHQFSFRTLWLALTVICIGFGLDAYHGKWIRQRRAALAEDGIQGNPSKRHSIRDKPYAPNGLWIFGECGQSSIHVSTEHFSDARIEELRQLFPEARFLLMRKGKYERLPALRGEP